MDGPYKASYGYTHGSGLARGLQGLPTLSTFEPFADDSCSGGNLKQIVEHEYCAETQGRM